MGLLPEGIQGIRLRLRKVWIFFAFAFELMDRFDDGIVVIFTVPSKRDSLER